MDKPDARKRQKNSEMEKAEERRGKDEPKKSRREMRLEGSRGRVVPAVQAERENQAEEAFAAEGREEVWTVTVGQL